MNSSQSNADMLAASMKKGKKKIKSFRSTDSSVDPGFLRDMGYGAKKKKKKVQ